MTKFHGPIPHLFGGVRGLKRVALRGYVGEGGVAGRFSPPIDERPLRYGQLGHGAPGGCRLEIGSRVRGEGGQGQGHQHKKVDAPAANAYSRCPAHKSLFTFSRWFFVHTRTTAPA
ncbi:MAG: hypothetical protein AB7P69_00085 [Candidatus Binatia bacterium]